MLEEHHAKNLGREGGREGGMMVRCSTDTNLFLLLPTERDEAFLDEGEASLSSTYIYKRGNHENASLVLHSLSPLPPPLPPSFPSKKQSVSKPSSTKAAASSSITQVFKRGNQENMSDTPSA